MPSQSGARIMSAGLAKIHIARKETGIHEDDYRSMLVRLTGQNTAKGLTEPQIGRVLEEFKAHHGWKPSVIKGGRKDALKRKTAAANHPTANKARALWISLHQLGSVREPSEKALEAFARRQLRCTRLVWADQQQMFKLIEALKAMAERAGWSQDLAGVDPALHTSVLKARLEAAIKAREGR